MYPPRRRGADPIADWLDEDAGPQLSVDRDLQGTAFTDPVRNWLLTSQQPDQRSKFVRGFDWAVDKAFSPIKAITDKAKQFSNWITEPVADEGPARSMAKGFLGGATEGAAELTSPFNIATAASGLSGAARLPGALGSLLRMAEGAGGAFQAGATLPAAAEAIERGDYRDAAAQGGMAAMGLAGSAAALKGPARAAAIEGQVLPPRRAPVSRQLGADLGEIIEGEVVPPPRQLDAGDPLAFLMEGEPPPAQRLLPENAGPGPILTPPPPGSVPDVVRYGADVRWQHPRSSAPPSAGDAAVVGQPATSQAPAAVAPSTELAALRAQLQKEGYPAELIERILAADAAGETTPVSGTVTPPDPRMATLPSLDERMAARAARDAAEVQPVTQQPVAQKQPPVAENAAADPLAALLEIVESGRLEDPAAALSDLVADPNVDALTNLQNRRGWDRGQQKPNRLYGRIDLDNFKAVNDVLGHEAGDSVLQAVGDALRQFTRRKGDRGGRLGGDEFALDLEAPSDPAATESLRDTIEKALADAIAATGHGRPGDVEVGASVGFGPDDVAADLAAIARKKERGISRPRQPDAAIDAGAPAGVGSTPPDAILEPAPQPGQLVAGDRPPDAAGAVPAVGGRRRAPRAQVDPLAAEADAGWPDVLDDARSAGFTGTDDELRALYDDRVRSARELIDDLSAIRGESGPTALLQEIRRLGGLQPFTKDFVPGMKTRNLRGDFASIVENFKQTHGQAGASSVFRKEGLALDDLLQQLAADPKWAHLADERTFLDELDTISRGLVDDAVPGMGSALEAAGVRRGSRWWSDEGDTSFDPDAFVRGDEPDSLAALDEAIEGPATPRDALVDVLETGEAQPRLPGAVGEVRDANVPPPEFDAPFSLAREAAPTPQPTKQDALTALLEPDEGPRGRIASLPEGDREGYARVPFRVADDATINDLAQRADYSQPQLGMVRIDDLIATQPTITRDVAMGKLDTPVPRLDELPVGSYGSPSADGPIVIRDVDGSLYLAGGTHSTVAAWAKGEPEIQAVIYPTKGARTSADLAVSPDTGAAAPKAPVDTGALPQGASAATEPVRPAAPAVPDNVRDFLVRQLNYTPDEVATMGRAAAVALGNKVRMHEGGVAGGIAAYAKPKPPPFRSSEPGPNLGEGSTRVEADELAKLLGVEERRTAMQRTRVEPGEGAPATPKLTAAQLERAQTLASESEAARVAAAAGPAPKKTQSEIATDKTVLVQEARRRAKLLDNPTPENLDEYARLLGEAADRQARREFKGGTAKEGQLKQHERTGEYLASGVAGFEKMYRERPDLFWRAIRIGGGALAGALATGEDSAFGDDPLAGALMGAAAGAAGPKLLKLLAAKAPTAAKALKDLLPEAMGGPKGGAPRGSVSPVRAPRDLSKDISGAEALVYGQPHRTVPDVWQQISPVLDDLATAEKNLPSSTPRMMEFTRRMYLEEAIGDIQHAVTQTKAQGLHRRAKYLEALIDELKERPTMLERLGSDLTSGKVAPKDVAKVLARAEKALYVKLLGFALDTAIVNRTQVSLAIPHIGVKGVFEGMKRARTPEGKAATRFLDIEDPVDAPRVPGGRVKPSLLRKIVKTALSPLRASDVKNRKDVYLGAMYHARKQGLDPAQAHEWAMEITTQTQGWPGELGSNPFHRQLGPLRMFTKYPSIWSQWAADIATHPDPVVRRRGLAMMLGVPIAGAAFGINALSFLIPRVGFSLPAAEGAKDLASHIPGVNQLTGPADHPLSEDLTPTNALRYPGKVLKETKDFGRYGFGTHKEFDAGGSPKGEHSAWTGFLSLLGIESTERTGNRAVRDEAYDFITDRGQRATQEGREHRRDLREAIESGDTEAAAEAARQMSPAQIRDFYRRHNKTPYQLMLERVPKKDRAEFERRFKQRFQGTQ